ncbi:MAG: hypothetical protein GEV28_18145 [Actinophytocola sp.]|nr:hypothetical protein [Actinophytocola sp.]
MPELIRCVDELPRVPTVVDLHWSAMVAARGHTTDTELLAVLLLSAARAGADVVPSAERLLADAEPRVWLSLDRSIRRAWDRASDWSASVADQLSDKPLELVLVACHPDGRVREAAVDRLVGLSHLFVPPVLALRAADWVPEVRDRARRACARLLETGRGTAALAPVAKALRYRRDGGWLAARLTGTGADTPR